jgi:hypothetical protein
MKKLIFFVLILFSSIVCSEELKLSCNIKLTTNYDDGTTENGQYSEVFAIKDLGKHKFIIPTSNTFGSVSTLEGSKTLSIKDFSDSSKWDISVENNGLKEGVTYTTTIRIDRNVGKIWYSHTFFRDGKVRIEDLGNGDCEKINVTKKKF